ncbi:MAG: hypothetical protein OXH11_04335 [Candidatus Aminicenantes bacterium]|nr:hypothetical protein [Candidatus Aminicenantes bacterium]
MSRTEPPVTLTRKSSPRSSFLGRCCLALVLAGGIAQPVRGQAAADSDPRKWEFSFLAGTGFLSDRTLGPAASGNGSALVRLDYDAGYSLAFGVIENLAEKFGAEMRYGIGSLPVAAGSLTEGSAAPKQAHHVHGLVYSLIVYPQGWRRGRLVPYALAGLGASLFQPSGNADGASQGLVLKNHWKLAGEMGGGVKLYLDPPWGLRFEVRNRITGVPDYGHPRAPSQGEGPGSAPPASGRLHHWQFQAGFTYNFAP